MRYLWTPSLPAAWSLQSDGPTRTWKWDKCEVEAQMGRPEFPDWTSGFHRRDGELEVGEPDPVNCIVPSASS
jgi:hypothetical protein